MDKIRVIIVDDDLEWIKIISKNLPFEKDIAVVATASNPHDAIEVTQTLKPDVILMDINLTGSQEDRQSGILLTLSIIRELNSKIVMLSSISDEETFKKSFLAGCVQYVEKRDAKGLADVIRICVRKENPMQTLITEFKRLKREELLNTLTLEERRIFELYETGCTSKQVEEQLFKSRNTLRNQIKSINKKLNAKSIIEAILKVRSSGFNE
ncbi:MAG TPA: response regulator transcription factor [Clostridia bacterium]